MEAGGWSIGYDDALLLERELDRFAQRTRISVLEFGSGLSTFVILSKLEASFTGSYRFLSVEGDGRWHKKMRQQVGEAYPSIGPGFELLEVGYVCEEGMQTFDLTRVRNAIEGGGFDLILVDAPPDTNGEDVRLNLCLAARSMLNPKGVLMLHDTNRINELNAFQKIQEGFAMSQRIETQKGMGIFRFPGRPAGHG
jgi:hypothetical protein